MSLIAVAAGKGSRGVTTAALALAAVWPQQRRVLLAECDPGGGTLAVRFGLRPAPGLLTLASVARRNLDPQELWSHVQTLPGGGLEALLGPVRAEQSLALGRLWSDLPLAIARLDADVIADCGRLFPGSPVEPLLRAADQVVLVCTPTPEGVLQLQTRVEALAPHGVRPVVLLVGEQPYGAREVGELLEAETASKVAAIAVLADDPRAARMLAGEPGRARYFDRSLLVRSAREVANRLAARLTPPPPEPDPDPDPERDPRPEAESLFTPAAAAAPPPPPPPAAPPEPPEGDPFDAWMQEVKR
jgi:MinD-like ATPase involved in chromosome partitioning or flagellar assembly